MVPAVVPPAVTAETGSQREKNDRAAQEEQDFSYGALGELKGVERPLNTRSGALTYACAREACPERAVEAALRDATKALGGMCWKLSSPGTAGVPDRLVLLPGGRVGFVECKTTGAKPRPQQVRRLEQLARLGFTALVLDHVDDVEEVLNAIRAGL